MVDLTNSKTGELMPSIISVDRLTNELIALKTEFVKIPDEIKGVKLNDEQKQTLMEGKSLYLEGMISKRAMSLVPMYSLMRIKDMLSFCLIEVTIISKHKKTGRTISKANRRKLRELLEVRNLMMNNTISSKLDKLFI